MKRIAATWSSFRLVVLTVDAYRIEGDSIGRFSSLLLSSFTSC